jgi:hypothetical protein
MNEAQQPELAMQIAKKGDLHQAVATVCFG